jgi:IS5 family transposase
MREMEEDEAMTRRALELLGSRRNDRYEATLAALLQESLSVAHKTGALETKDLERVVVDTTVQPKAVAHPTDARLMYRAIEKRVAPAKRHGVPCARAISGWPSRLVSAVITWLC